MYSFGQTITSAIIIPEEADWNSYNVANYYHITGSKDLLIGNSKNNTFKSGDGDDSISGDDGDDVIYGDNGSVNEVGGNDTISGGAGKDGIYGGKGNDVITGGAGADSMNGNAGADIFIFGKTTDSTSLMRDTIIGFEQRIDKIKLTGLGFSGLDTDGGKTETGELRFNGSILMSDLVDFQISFSGDKPLETDFLWG
jgi:Ca2+-binding RTX toxin-like protein